MRRTLELGREGLGVGGSRARKFLEDSVDTVRAAYLAVYALCLVLALIIGSFTPYSGVAAGFAMLGVIICGAISYLFGARLIVGVVGYRVLRRFLRKFVGTDITDVSLLDIWYWKAFIAMWTTAPLAGLAIFRPWEAGRILQLLFATFLILHVVATQREMGNIWRKVYATTATGVLLVVLFAIVFPGDYARLKGNHQRRQQLGLKLSTVNQQLANLEDNITDAILAGLPTTGFETGRVRLEAAKTRIQEQINAQSSWMTGLASSIDLHDEQAKLRVLFIVPVIVFVVAAFFNRKKTSTTTSH